MTFAERIDQADKRFNKAVQVFNKLPSSIQPDHGQEVRIYATLMQATKGDNHTDRPGGLDIRAIAKWSAWNGLYGIPKYEAQEFYVQVISDVIGPATNSEEGKRLFAELNSA